MNNIEKNAIRIAELRGWKLIVNDRGIKIFGRDKDMNSDGQIAERYASYKYLMPIVFECNSGYSYGITIRTEDTIFHNYTKEKVYFNYDTEPEFIEAIQLACIKYLELKSNGQIKT